MNHCAEQLSQKFQSDCNQQLAACYLRSYAGKARKLARSKPLKGKPRITTTLDLGSSITRAPGGSVDFKASTGTYGVETQAKTTQAKITACLHRCRAPLNHPHPRI